jgi:probable F420-dependent oxidoreductase
VRIGITTFVTDYTIDIVTLARAVEERGFASLYLAEHTHIPASRQTPAPMGGELGREYSHLVDPFVALAAAAAVTESLTLGTGVSLVAEHDAVALAKQIATLDNLCGGRFVLGVGYGWNREEMATHGVDYADRREIVRETVLLMKALWRDDEASFRGEHLQLEPSWQWPKPLRRDVPVLLGGQAGPKFFDAICDYADGWIPFGGAGLSKTLSELRALWADAGRDPAALRCVPFGTIPDEGKLEHYASLGIDEVVLRIDEGSTDDVLRRLDRAAALR